MTNPFLFFTINNPRRLRPLQSLLVGLITILLSVQALEAADSLLTNSESPLTLRGKQGEVLWLEIPVSHSKSQVSGLFLTRNIPFFQKTETRFAAMIGIDMQDPPGTHSMNISIQSEDHTEHVTYSIEILKEHYPVQHLTLPKNKVDLDSKTLQRVRLEQKEMSAAFKNIGAQPLWDGTFLEPTTGTITGRFGSRRVINGQHKRPHSGEDIAAPRGTPVLAINKGTVVAAVDHFFSGKGVVIDHGVGLFSMYFHLSEIDVEPGQTLQKGETLGKVGATGRATGPHLHWGIRLNGARVNPYALTALPLEG